MLLWKGTTSQNFVSVRTTKYLALKYWWDTITISNDSPLGFDTMLDCRLTGFRGICCLLFRATELCLGICSSHLGKDCIICMMCTDESISHCHKYMAVSVTATNIWQTSHCLDWCNVAQHTYYWGRGRGNQDASVLFPSAKSMLSVTEHVRPLTTIMMWGWRSYAGPSIEKFQNLTVNPLQSIDSESVSTHTTKIYAYI